MTRSLATTPPPPPAPSRASPCDNPAEDPRPAADPSAPPSPAPSASQPVSTRRVARQATSAVAYAPAPEPEEDDPLLAFAPFVHPAPRRNSITPDLQRRFVATLAATGIVNQAARRIGKSMEALYKLRARPGAEGFAAAWDAALDRGVQRLEDCALERALQGTATPIVSGGQLVGYWDKPDNTLLRFLLQHRLPQRYGVQDLRPGHPIYDGIRAEVLAEADARHADAAKALRKQIADLKREVAAQQRRAEIAEERLEDLEDADNWGRDDTDGDDADGDDADGDYANAEDRCADETSEDARLAAVGYRIGEDTFEALERGLYRPG